MVGRKAAMRGLEREMMERFGTTGGKGGLDCKRAGGLGRDRTVVSRVMAVV